jgi:superfamily II DNA or RNA helicase
MITVDYNKSYRKGKIITDEFTLNKIRSHFSLPVENIDIVRKRADNPHIPDTTHAIQPTGMYDFGLSQDILNILDDNNFEYETTKEFDDFLNCGYQFSELFDDLNYQNRYYGLETIKKCLTEGRGTVVWATGAGKSFLQASLIENIWRLNKKPFKCLILVPGLGLVSQLLENFQEYGVNFTYSGWTGGINGLSLQNTEVVICNSENFCAKFSDNQKWIKKVDLLLVDECHKISNGAVLSKNVQKIPTPHKFGFTGTLPKDKMNEWKVIGTFGPVIYEKNSKELRDEGFLSNACIKMVKLNHRNPRNRSYKAEVKFLEQDKSRHLIIRKIVQRLNNNVLLLVNSIDHGIDLSILLNGFSKRVYFVRGETPVEKRLKIIQEMEERNDVICIAMSSIFSTGINIKNLHYIVFIVGGKSFIRIVQSIGRGLRLHESKNKLTLIDIYDNMEYSMAHADKRKDFYDEQEIEWKEIEINI